MRLPYDLERIDVRYLESLIGEPEGYALDFKREIDLRTDKGKFEIAADVTSFANDAGGDIFIGIDEESGVASAVVCFCENVADALDRQLAQSLQGRTDPRVPFRTHPVRIGDGRVVLVVRVPRSGAAPHAVRHDDNLRFFGRNRTGKYPLNVAQIRERFLAAGSLEERLRAFVHARWAVEDDATGGMFSGADAARFFLHIVPYAALLGEASVDAEAVYSNTALASFFYTDSGYVTETRMTADGVQFARGRREKTWSTTSQLFSDGRVERVSRDIGNQMTPDGPLLLSDEALLKDLGDFVPRALQGLARLGVEPPYFVVGSLTHIRGFYWWGAFGPRSDAAFPIDRDSLLLPTCVLERSPTNPQEALDALRPLVGGLLHACGLTTEGWYRDGTFIRRRR